MQITNKIRHNLELVMGKSALFGFLNKMALSKNSSVAVQDKLIIKEFLKDPNNNLFISFPRTGSHWIRMIMELYFEKPSLIRVFYYPEKSDFLTLHTHDLDLNIEHPKIIYLYRDPVNTVYSQLKYLKEDIRDKRKIAHWADLYGKHLFKWLHTEAFTKKKTIVRYEYMQKEPQIEFKKICDHFNYPFDIRRLYEQIARVSKEHVKNKTTHDPQVINLDKRYAEEREEFRVNQYEIVWGTLLNGRKAIESYLGQFESLIEEE